MTEEIHTETKKMPIDPPDTTPSHASISESKRDIKADKKKRNHTLFWLTMALIIAGVIWLLLWIFYFQYHEYTDDAYVNGNMVNVTSVISGVPIAYFVDSTDLVIQGQLIAKLDPTPYQIAYEKELANLASTVLQVKQLYDNVKLAEAGLASQKALLSKAQFDYENRRSLVNDKAISVEDFIHSRDTLTQAEANVAQATAQLLVAKDAAGQTPIEFHPALLAQKSAVRTAFYNLSHCTIYAPCTGYVAQRKIQVGEWVSPASYLMAIIPADYIWVDANYKETELTNVRIGQPAKVTFDIYGSDVVFEGKVLGIASGTGSVFSILPPQNATGNWIKIVQRLPVRIGLDPQKIKEYPLRIGLSAEVKVDTTHRNLPMLAEQPALRPIATTHVFELNLGEVDKIIDQIITQNLNQ